MSDANDGDQLSPYISAVVLLGTISRLTTYGFHFRQIYGGGGSCTCPFDGLTTIETEYTFDKMTEHNYQLFDNPLLNYSVAEQQFASIESTDNTNNESIVYHSAELNFLAIKLILNFVCLALIFYATDFGRSCTKLLFFKLITVAAASPTNQPNILIFYLDDVEFTLSWMQSAPNGLNLNGKSITYPNYPTPNIAAFMSESIIFSNSHASAPSCAPARYSLLTGRMPSRSLWAIEQTLSTSNGAYGTNVSVPVSRLSQTDSLLSIPYILQNDANTPYYTGVVGKWHLMTNGDDIEYNHGCSKLGRTQNTLLYSECTDIVKQQGFDFVDAWYVSNIGTNNLFSHNPEWMVSQSQKMIDHAVNVEKKPFFLYFASTLTHTPDVLTALKHFAPSDSPKGTLGGVDDPSDTLMKSRSEILQMAYGHGFRMEKRTERFAAYYWMDDSFGALINYLKVNNLYDDTLIVLMSDHGMGAKGLLYEQGTRTINFVRYPPLFGTQQHIMPKDFVVSSVDLAPVIFELSGVSPPFEYIMDGTSWISDMQSEISNNNEVNVQQSCCHFRFIDQYNSRSIVTAHYQYIYRANPQNVDSANWYTYMKDEEQLYDLVNDPSQRVNQIGNVAYASVVYTFQRLMNGYIQHTCPTATTMCKVPSYLFSATSPVYSKNTLNLTFNPTSSPTINPTELIDDFELITTMGNDDLQKSNGMDKWIKLSKLGVLQIVVYVGSGYVLCVALVFCLYHMYRCRRKQYGYVKTESKSNLSVLPTVDEEQELEENDSEMGTHFEMNHGHVLVTSASTEEVLQNI